jgi:hypothetical protein
MLAEDNIAANPSIAPRVESFEPRKTSIRRAAHNPKVTGSNLDRDLSLPRKYPSNERKS